MFSRHLALCCPEDPPGTIAFRGHLIGIPVLGQATWVEWHGIAIAALGF